MEETSLRSSSSWDIYGWGFQCLALGWSCSKKPGDTRHLYWRKFWRSYKFVFWLKIIIKLFSLLIYSKMKPEAFPFLSALFLTLNYASENIPPFFWDRFCLHSPNFLALLYVGQADLRLRDLFFYSCQVLGSEGVNYHAWTLTFILNQTTNITHSHTHSHNVYVRWTLKFVLFIKINCLCLF